MNTSRYAAIPIDHAIAEMAAFPIASEAALQLVITELNPIPSGSTALLWREAERKALGGFPAFSVDEAVALRDQLWFFMAGNTIPLHRYLQHLAREYLEVCGTYAVPTLPEETSRWFEGFGNLPLAGPSLPGSLQARARRFWRWLSFALPPDLLLAALPASNGVAEAIDLVAPVLKQNLQDHEYAETHMHIGAALDFSLLWVSTLRVIADPQTGEGAFRSPGAELNEGKDLAAWLVRAAIARYLLAAFLVRDDKRGQDLEAFLHEVVFAKVLEIAGATATSVLSVALTDLSAGRLASPGPGFLASLQTLYVQLAAVAYAKPMAETLDEVQQADPIAEFFGAKPYGQTTPEMRFVSKALSYLELHAKDVVFATLFWQVVRIRALLYRHVVQRPMTPGLQWFVRFYGRIGPARRATESKLPALEGYKDLQVQSAATLSGIHRGLRSLELRTSPDTDVSGLRLYIASADETFQSLSEDESAAAKNGLACCNPKEFGMVFHFTKDRGGHAREGTPTARWLYSNADPGSPVDPDPSKPFGNPTGYRYAHFFNKKMAEARSLAWVLRHYPISLELIRGIDVATDELGVPTWVIAPIFRYVRKASKEASAALRQICALEVPPLRTTAHVGEDFIHLLTGLRNVDEALTRFDLREGDRIGHGVALGIDPRAWGTRAGRIPMAREDRLLDLVWEFSWYGCEGWDPPRGRAQLIEREIARLSQRVFRKTIAPIDIELMIDYLYHKDWLTTFAGFPNGPPPTSLNLDRGDPKSLFVQYLTDRSVFLAGRQIEWIDPSAEAAALAGLQAGVRRKLGECGITVEVNPSSNLLIGDLGDLSQHPLWRLSPPVEKEDDAPPVSICIGSDDPLTFATNLPQEYQLMHDALTLTGLSEEQARQWLDRVRTTGLENRFTVRRTHDTPVTYYLNL